MRATPLAINRDARYERWRWQIATITWLAYVGYYFTRKSFAVAKVGILDDPTMGLTKSGLGIIDMFYGLAYALGMFFCGWMSDRWGPRRVVLTGMACSISVALLMGLPMHYVLFGALFFIQGLCQSSGWAPLTKNMSSWFSRRERGRVFGFWSTNYAFGGMLASGFAGYAALTLGSWRYAFILPALVLLLIAVLFFFLQRNRPQDVGLPLVDDYHGEPREVLVEPTVVTHKTAWTVLKDILANPMLLRLGLVYFLIKPTRYALLFWGPVIIHERIHTNIGNSAFISGFFEATGPMGVILAGFFSDKVFRSRRIPVVVIGLFCLALVLFAFITITKHGGNIAMILMLAAIGCFLFGPDTLIAGTCAVDFGAKDGAGSAAGFINGLGSIGQILGLWLPGIISERYGWGTLFTGMGCSMLLAALILVPKWNAVPVQVVKPNHTL